MWHRQRRLRAPLALPLALLAGDAGAVDAQDSPAGDQGGSGGGGGGPLGASVALPLLLVPFVLLVAAAVVVGCRSERSRGAGVDVSGGQRASLSEGGHGGGDGGAMGNPLFDGGAPRASLV